MTQLLIGALAIAATLLAPTSARSQPVEERPLSAVVREADGSRTLLQSIVVAAPLAQVWAALTTSEGWRTWAAPVAFVDFRLGGIIETSYRPDAVAGSPSNIRNQIVAFLPPRMFAIRNVQAPPGAPFDVAAFQSLHTVVLVDRVDDARTRVTFAQPGYGDGTAFDGVLKHFEWGNAWTLQQLRKRFDSGPVDWTQRAGSASK